jgi:hypothetical protein
MDIRRLNYGVITLLPKVKEATKIQQYTPICFAQLHLQVVHEVHCRSGFATLSPVPLQEQPAVVLLLEGALISWSLAINERGGHRDLRGSGRWSVIPYVHMRMKLYCSSMYA